MPSSPSETPAYALRPAGERDSTLVYRIAREAMKSYVDATWGWDEEAQREIHRRRFEPGRDRIVLVGDDPVGLLRVERGPDEIVLKSVYLLARWQGRGIGSSILSGLLAEARERTVPLRLGVLRVNERARRLYERHGLAVVETTETHHYMVYAAPDRA
jgi:GNAT superfamily N-acetyltransferase